MMLKGLVVSMLCLSVQGNGNLNELQGKLDSFLHEVDNQKTSKNEIKQKMTGNKLRGAVELNRDLQEYEFRQLEYERMLEEYDGERQLEYERILEEYDGERQLEYERILEEHDGERQLEYERILEEHDVERQLEY
eukprot:snap_masked-scaffold_9-processed-gene-12.41-mRNA-1 protein AED:1.00 eAED:1.00 QI:0/-1/0/0/-1/1/1/0/134